MFIFAYFRFIKGYSPPQGLEMEKKHPLIIFKNRRLGEGRWSIIGISRRTKYFLTCEMSNFSIMTSRLGTKKVSQIRARAQNMYRTPSMYRTRAPDTFLFINSTYFILNKQISVMFFFLFTKIRIKWMSQRIIVYYIIIHEIYIPIIIVLNM